MTDKHADLFAELDAIADVLREELGRACFDDLQIEFRRRQKARLPDLTREQWFDLFHEWLKHHLAKQQAELAEIRRRMLELDAERHALLRDLPRGEPFRCPCGELIYSWSPEIEWPHREHVFVAGLDRLTK